MRTFKGSSSDILLLSAAAPFFERVFFLLCLVSVVCPSLLSCSSSPRLSSFYVPPLPSSFVYSTPSSLSALESTLLKVYPVSATSSVLENLYRNTKPERDGCTSSCELFGIWGSLTESIPPYLPLLRPPHVHPENTCTTRPISRGRVRHQQTDCNSVVVQSAVGLHRHSLS